MRLHGDFNIVAAAVIFIVPLISAELPSCYRARCSHCTVEFIANMCPTTCSSCGVSGDSTYGPKLRPGRPLHVNGGATGNARVHGVPAVSSQSTAQRELHLQLNGGTSEPNAAPISSAPVAQQLPDAPQYNSAYTSQQQSQQQIYSPQQNFQSQQPYVAQQQQPFAYPQQQQIPQTTSYGSSYGSPNYPAAGAQPQFGSYGSQSGQQLPYYGSQQSSFGSQPYYETATAAPASQPFNFFQPSAPNQPAPSPFLNPFQPFLQQSLQAQQQAPFFQPFTPSPFTPSPMFAGLATPAPAPSLGAAQPQSPTGSNGPISSLPPPPPALPSYLPSSAPVPQPAQVLYATQGQQQYAYVPQVQTGAQVPVEVQRPKQIYAQPQPQPQLPPQPISQSYNVPRVPQQQVAPAVGNSIDSVPNYISSNFGDKPSAAQLQTCPKQPNWEPCISKEVANERFRNCCLRLGEGCSQLCSYDQTLATIQIAVLTGRCPLGKVADMMICASGYEDATACCQAYNVFEPGFEHCRPYCNPAGGLPNDGMLAEKYRCLGKLSQIQRCFYVSQKP